MNRFSLTVFTAMLGVLGGLPGCAAKASLAGLYGGAAVLFERYAELRGGEAAKLEERAARILVNCDRDKDSLVASVAHEAFHAFCAQVSMDLEHPRDDERFASAEALAKQNLQTGSPMDLVSLRSFKIFSGGIMRPVVRIKKARRRVYRRRAGRLQPWIFIP